MAAFEDASRPAGIPREATWIQPTPGGDVVVVYLEADDIAAAFMTGTSDEPFDRWFRDHVRDVHDVDMAEDFLLPEQIPDFRAEPAS